jgi:O-antigen/teichoic acid export membrane protein
MDLSVKKQNTIKSSLFLIFDKLLRVIIGLIVGVWLARYMGKFSFGQLNFSLSIVAITSVLTSGFGGVAVKKFMHPDINDSLFLNSALLLQFIYGLFSFLIPLIYVFLFYNIEDHDVYKFIFILSIPNIFKFTDIFRNYFESKFLIHQIVLIEFTVFFLVTLVRIFLIINGVDIVFFVILISFESVLLSLIWAFKFRKKLIIPNFFSTTYSSFMNLFKISYPIILSGIGVIIYMRLDIIMIKYFSGNEDVGLYSAALRISEGIYFIPMALMPAINPLLLNYFNDKIRYHLLYRNLLILFNIISISFCIFFSFSSDFFIEFLYGLEFSGAGDILVIHIWITIFVFLGIPLSSYLIFEEKSNVLMYKVFIGLIINILLNLFLIPSLGAKGAAYATLITQFFVSFILNFFFTTCRTYFFIQLSSLNFRNFSNAISFFKKTLLNKEYRYNE